MNQSKTKPMKPIARLLASVILATIALVGCAHMPSVNNTVVVPANAQNADLLEIAIEAAKDAKLPPVSKLDKPNGVVEFGGFTMPEMGASAQVGIRSEKNLDVTVKRGSVYVPLPVDKIAAEFRQKIEARLQQVK